MKHILIGMAGTGAALWTTAATAHDFFLMPQKFEADAKSGALIQATVGSSFPSAEIVVTVDRVDKTLANAPGKPEVHVLGAGEKSLNLHVAGAGNGLLVAAVGTKPRDVDYGEDRIPLILGEYRVAPDAVAAVNALPKPRNWQVVSRRFAKTFVCIDSCRDRSAAEKSMGASLEFVGSSSGLDHFQLLAGGKPLANYPVDLVGSDGKRQHLSTDAKGAVHLAAAARGTMMLFAAKLEPPVGAARFTLDLTSLTFNRP